MRAGKRLEHYGGLCLDDHLEIGFRLCECSKWNVLRTHMSWETDNEVSVKGDKSVSVMRTYCII